MMTLRKMTEDEFRAFKKFSVADYAVDLMKGRDISPEQALMEAENDEIQVLPDRCIGQRSGVLMLMQLKGIIVLPELYD